jgi:hypothetical protein
MGTGALSPEVKQLGHEADHSPPAIAEVKNTWIYTSNFPYVYIAWCLRTILLFYLLQLPVSVYALKL